VRGDEVASDPLLKKIEMVLLEFDKGKQTPNFGYYYFANFIQVQVHSQDVNRFCIRRRQQHFRRGQLLGVHEEEVQAYST
jgi:hypothetical protein